MFSRVQGQCFRWWRDIFFNERLRSIMIEEADEPDYEPIVWTLFEAAGLISIWKALRNRRKQMQSTAVMPPKPNPLSGFDSEEEECDGSEEDLPPAFWSDDKDAERISFFYWKLANKEIDDVSIDFSEPFITEEQNGQNGFLLDHERAQHSHAEMRQAVLFRRRHEEEQFLTSYEDSDTSIVEDLEAEDLWDDTEYEEEEGHTEEEQEGASEYIGDRLEQYGLEQAIEASQTDENAHDQPTSVEIT